MSIVSTIETKETKHVGASTAKYRWFAARDASMNSAMNANRFTDATKIKAHRIALVLDQVYSNTRIEVHHNKKFIRVKVFDAVIKDRKNLRELEAMWACENIVKVRTAQGIIYRVSEVATH